jgi:hypothetical protein
MHLNSLKYFLNPNKKYVYPLVIGMVVTPYLIWPILGKGFPAIDLNSWIKLFISFPNDFEEKRIIFQIFQPTYILDMVAIRTLAKIGFEANWIQVILICSYIISLIVVTIKLSKIYYNSFLFILLSSSISSFFVYNGIVFFGSPAFCFGSVFLWFYVYALLSKQQNLSLLFLFAVCLSHPVSLFFASVVTTYLFFFNRNLYIKQFIFCIFYAIFIKVYGHDFVWTDDKLLVGDFSLNDIFDAKILDINFLMYKMWHILSSQYNYAHTLFIHDLKFFSIAQYPVTKFFEVFTIITVIFTIYWIVKFKKNFFKSEKYVLFLFVSIIYLVAVTIQHNPIKHAISGFPTRVIQSFLPLFPLVFSILIIKFVDYYENTIDKIKIKLLSLINKITFLNLSNFNNKNLKVLIACIFFIIANLVGVFTSIDLLKAQKKTHCAREITKNLIINQIDQQVVEREKILLKAQVFFIGWNEKLHHEKFPFFLANLGSTIPVIKTKIGNMVWSDGQNKLEHLVDIPVPFKVSQSLIDRKAYPVIVSKEDLKNCKIMQ